MLATASSECKRGHDKQGLEKTYRSHLLSEWVKSSHDSSVLPVRWIRNALDEAKGPIRRPEEHRSHGNEVGKPPTYAAQRLTDRANHDGQHDK